MDIVLHPTVRVTHGRGLTTVVVVSAVILWLSPVSTRAGGESAAVGNDAISHAEEVLTQAAKESPQRDRQDAVQREVLDITFLLDQSSKAAEKSDHGARKEYAQQALTLLQRSVTRGYFHHERVEPVMTLIRQLLSDQAG